MAHHDATPSAGFDLDRIGGLSGLKQLQDEVLAAGADAQRLFEAGLQVRHKGDRSPVTQADEAVEERLRAFLAKRYPDAGFLGEESGERDGNALRFIVDPIDGTQAFVRGLPTWSVLLALEFEGVPALGIAYMPAQEELYVGWWGGGATCNGHKLQVSSVASLEDAVIAHGALQQFTQSEHAEILARLADNTRSARGLADFDGHRQVLQGRVDAMVDPGVKPYDVCSAAVLVHEAGGRFTDLNGAATVYGDGAVSSNGLIHDTLLQKMRG